MRYVIFDLPPFSPRWVNYRPFVCVKFDRLALTSGSMGNKKDLHRRPQRSQRYREDLGTTRGCNRDFIAQPNQNTRGVCMPVPVSFRFGVVSSPCSSPQFFAIFVVFCAISSSYFSPPALTIQTQTGSLGSQIGDRSIFIAFSSFILNREALDRSREGVRKEPRLLTQPPERAGPFFAIFDIHWFMGFDYPAILFRR